MSPTRLARALGAESRPLGPPAQGWVTAASVWRAVLEARPYPVRMLMSFGTNLLASQPQPDLARRALAALPFHVHADFFVNATDFIGGLNGYAQANPGLPRTWTVGLRRNF